MAEQPALQLTNISKSFGPLLANDQISLTLNAGEVLALLGENGAGKTTLMNILFGHYQADSGSVRIFGQELPPGKPRAAISAGVGMVHQHFTLADNLTVLENITLGTESLRAKRSKTLQAEQKIAHLATTYGLEVNPRALIRDLSVGERQRVEILKALYRDARILIMDEPTAVLTPPEVTSLFKTLNTLVKQGLAVIFISHKLREVMEISQRVAVLRHGKIVAEVNTADTTREELAEAMVGRTVPKPKRGELAAGKPLFSFIGVDVDGAGAENNKLLDNISLEIREHEILGIAGVSGNGQNQLAELLCGLRQQSAGTIQIDGKGSLKPSPAIMIKQGIGRIVEDRHGLGLIGDMSVTENLCAEEYKTSRFANFGLRRFSAMKEQSTSLINDYDVRCQGINAPVRQLSGGNMQKLILARVLSRQPRIILAHQPTWGLDVGATAYVHDQLLAARQRGAGVLLISEDLDELLQLSDRIQVLFHGQLSPALKTEEVTLQELGLRMSGQNPDQNSHAA